MGEELTTTVGVPAETPETPAAPAIPTPEEQALAPEVQAIVDAAVAKTKREYETVHIANLKSKYDKKIASLQKQADAGRQAKIQQAEMLEQSGDVEGANRLLKGAVAESRGQAEMELLVDQRKDWTLERLAEMDLDPEKDEGVVAVLAGLDPLDEHFGSAFFYETSKLLAQRVKETRKESKAELSKVPEIVKAEVKKALAAGGLDPDLGTPTRSSQDDLMKLPPTRRIAEILRRERQPTGK